MNTITNRLIELDPTLVIHNEGEWSGNPTSLYSAFNDGGVECETGEFLYSLIRLLKPERILETGTHKGIGASYMGLACEDNDKGTVFTIEFLRELHDEARARFERMGLGHRITSIFGNAVDYEPKETYDLILLDTEPQTRFLELTKYFKYLNEGGFIFIHDLHRHMHQINVMDHPFAWPYGEIPSEMHRLIGADFLRPFHFSTPRGLTGFYKVSKDDYKWPIKI